MLGRFYGSKSNGGLNAFDLIVAVVLMGAIDAAGPDGVVTEKPCAGGEQVQVIGEKGNYLYTKCKY